MTALIIGTPRLPEDLPRRQSLRKQRTFGSQLTSGLAQGLKTR